MTTALRISAGKTYCWTFSGKYNEAMVLGCGENFTIGKQCQILFFDDQYRESRCDWKAFM